MDPTLRDYRENPSFNAIDHFEDSVKEKLIRETEEDVLKWLADENLSPVHSVRFNDKNGERLWFPCDVQFHRSEINVKTCQNCWETWRIGVAANWPRIISYRVKSFCINDYNEGDVMHNEVRSDNYSSPVEA